MNIYLDEKTKKLQELIKQVNAELWELAKDDIEIDSVSKISKESYANEYNRSYQLRLTMQIKHYL